MNEFNDAFMGSSNDLAHFAGFFVVLLVEKIPNVESFEILLPSNKTHQPKPILDFGVEHIHKMLNRWVKLRRNKKLKKKCVNMYGEKRARHTQKNESNSKIERTCFSLSTSLSGRSLCCLLSVAIFTYHHTHLNSNSFANMATIKWK